MTAQLTTRLRRLGNSLAFLVPKPVRDLLGWDEYTQLKFEAHGNKLLVEPATKDNTIDLFKGA